MVLEIRNNRLFDVGLLGSVFLGAALTTHEVVNGHFIRATYVPLVGYFLQKVGALPSSPGADMANCFILGSYLVLPGNVIGYGAYTLLEGVSGRQWFAMMVGAAITKAMYTRAMNQFLDNVGKAPFI